MIMRYQYLGKNWKRKGIVVHRYRFSPPYVAWEGWQYIYIKGQA